MSHGDPWTVSELAVLAKAREHDRLTYPEAQERHFPDRTVSAIRSATRTNKYDEVRALVETAPQVFVAGEGVGRFVFPEIDLTLSAETFADLVQAYVYDGRGLTRAQVAREFGLTEDQMDHICQQYGLTKDSPPVPREVIAQQSDEEVIEATLQARERKLAADAEGRRTRHVENRYRKLLRKYQDRQTVLDRVERAMKEAGLFGSAPPEPDIIYEREAGPRYGAVHVPTADLHMGKLAWAPETGEDFDSLIAAERLRQHGEWAASVVADRGNAETVYLTDVGDFFHAMMSQTESGTSLDKDTRDLKVLDLAFEAKKHQVECMRRVAEWVEVIGVPGNHDHIFAQMFNKMLDLYYANVPDVSVDTRPGRYSGFMYGGTAHVLDHGKGVGKLTGWKAKAQVPTVTKVALGNVNPRRHVYYVGHLHELQVDTHTDMELRRLYPLCEADDFETSLRYASTPGAEVFFLGEDGMIQSIERFYPSRE